MPCSKFNSIIHVEKLQVVLITTIIFEKLLSILVRQRIDFQQSSSAHFYAAASVVETGTTTERRSLFSYRKVGIQLTQCLFQDPYFSPFQFDISREKKKRIVQSKYDRISQLQNNSIRNSCSQFSFFSLYAHSCSLSFLSDVSHKSYLTIYEIFPAQAEKAQMSFCQTR